jgi:hypothetical protein
MLYNTVLYITLGMLYNTLLYSTLLYNDMLYNRQCYITYWECYVTPLHNTCYITGCYEGTHPHLSVVSR